MIIGLFRVIKHTIIKQEIDKKKMIAEGIRVELKRFFSKTKRFFLHTMGIHKERSRVMSQFFVWI